MRIRSGLDGLKAKFGVNDSMRNQTRFEVAAGSAAAVILMSFLTVCWDPAFLHAREADPDSTRRNAVRTAAVDTAQTEELVLDEIQIRGRIERPGVLIMPKRVEPELEEVELERSFKKEVKEGVGEVPTPDRELGKVDRARNIKKTLKKKRK